MKLRASSFELRAGRGGRSAESCMSHSRTRLGLTLLILLMAACRGPERLEKNPDALDLLLREGEGAEAQGNAPAIHSPYQRAVEEFPDYSDAWSHLGEYQRFWHQDLAHAEASFRRAV